MSPRRLILPLVAAFLVGCPLLRDHRRRRLRLRPVTLLLGFQPDVQFAPFYLAQQDGLLRRCRPGRDDRVQGDAT